MEKPKGYEEYLSEYRPISRDSWSGEIVSWGFSLTQRMGEEKFNGLHKHGTLECDYGGGGSWTLITKRLTRSEAIEKYGDVTDEEFGPRGGWKSVTFGEKKFISKHLKG